MVLFKNRPISIMVLFAVSLHLMWAAILTCDQSAIETTSLTSLHRFIHSIPLLIAVLVVAALLALAGLFTRTTWVLLLLIPQQALLMMAAAGAIEAAWLGQFANGALNSSAFILAGQMYSILGAVFHTIAIVAHGRRINL